MISKGHSFDSVGHIGYSRKRKNSIISNCVGSAAFNGQYQTIKYCMECFPGDLDIEFKADEKPCGVGSFKKEVMGSTPLMLAVLAGDSNYPTVEWLIKLEKCNTEVRDSQGNNLLHLAVQVNGKTILKFLLENTKISPVTCNEIGKTPLDFAKEMELSEIEQMLSRFISNNDQKVKEYYYYLNRFY